MDMRRLVWILALISVLLALAYAVVFHTRAGQDFVLQRLVTAAMARTPSSPPAGGLRVFMCGTSSPLPAPNRAQACVAVMADDRLYLVDAGAGSPLVASLRGLPLENLRAVLLTHFHSDHIAAVGDFNLLSWVLGRPKPLEVIGPVGVSRVVSGLNEMYALDGSYRVAHHGAALLPPALHELTARTIEPGPVLQEGGLTVTAFRVQHDPAKPAVGYRFDYGGRSVVITGDTIVTEGLVEAARGADLMLADALSLPIVQALRRGALAAGRERQAKILKDIQSYHASTTSIAEAAQRAGVRQLALYHLVPAPRNALMRQIFMRDLPSDTLLTEDGMTFDLPRASHDVIVQ